MQWKDLTGVGEAPKQGYMLAYLRKEILFERYNELEDVRKLIEQEELLELHLFNQDKEYRCVASQSKRHPSGVVETKPIVDFKKDEKTTYGEMIYLETKYQKIGNTIQILNHLKYDENGMLEVDDYRLVMEEG